MHFLIIHGHRDCDLEAAEMIQEALNERSLESQMITDEEFLNNSNPNGYFIISVGEPKVNRVSGRIQETYPRAIDTSVYDMPNFCWAFGSKEGIKSNRHKLNNPCISLFGPRGEDTLKTAKDFANVMLDDIIKNGKTWTQSQ